MTEIPTTVKNKELVKKKREQIVFAAIRLFSQKSFFKTNMKDLAEEAGLSHGNIYDYVGSKEDIFILIHKTLADSAMTGLQEAMKGVKDPIEKLRRMVRAEFETMSQWPDALLLLYRESHIVSSGYLKKILYAERKHLSKFEDVINEGIQSGYIYNCNIRLNANLIKIMIDSWVLKRWDLRGYASQSEMEKSILDMTLHGIYKDQAENDNIIAEQKFIEDIRNKRALVINANTILGKSICGFLASYDVNVVAYAKNFKREREHLYILDKDYHKIKFYKEDDYGEMTPELLEYIEQTEGSIDFFIQDIGVGSTQIQDLNYYESSDKNLLEKNFYLAKRLATHYLNKKELHKSYGRIIYLAPWQWDQYIDSMNYEIIKNGTKSLTEYMSKHMAAYGINVNCIAPGFIKSVRPSSLQKKYNESLSKQIPAKSLGDISDVIETTKFLLSDASRYLNGQMINVDGGLY